MPTMLRPVRLLTLVLLSGCGLFRTETGTPATSQPAPIGETASTKAPIPYPLATCIVSGKQLGEDAVTFVSGGRTFRTCCTNCQETVEADPELWGHQVDATAIQEQMRDYPIETCIVSGKPLPDSAVSAMCGSTLVRLCCAGCRTRFQSEPSHFLARLETAKSTSYGAVALDTASWTPAQSIQWQRDQVPDYPLSTCPVSGKPIGENGAPHDVLLDGVLVRLCSEKCATKASERTAEIATAVQSAAFAQQKGNYPSSLCAVSGKPLGDRASSLMLGTTLVRTCNSACMKHLAENRSAIVATLHSAREAAAAAATAQGCCDQGGSCCCSTETKSATGK
ncbi:MAG: hypothetical protein ABL997_12810 [Planctomycetota bacterium]